MSTHGNGGTLLGRILTWFFVALLAIAALKLAFWLLGAALAVGFWVVFTLGPILLFGWLVLKLFRMASGNAGY